jgi:hypothetical protein
MGSTRRNESRESDSRASVAFTFETGIPRAAKPRRQYVKELGRRPMHIYMCGLPGYTGRRAPTVPHHTGSTNSSAGRCPRIARSS